MKARTPSSEFLHLISERLRYDPNTGRIAWAAWNGANGSARRDAGDEAGCVDRQGYRVVRVGAQLHRAHRVAWYLHTGVWPRPDEEVDHIDMDKANNRLSNLRLATHAQNAHNRPCRGAKGVREYGKRGRWYASICNNGHRQYLGSFDTQEAAITAYHFAAIQLRGDFHGGPR